MPITVTATAGAADANSYLTVADFQSYLATRLNVPDAVDPDDTDSLAVMLITATAVLDANMSGARRLEVHSYRGGTEKFYIIGRSWAGLPSDGVQALAWPRTGLLDKAGNALDSATIPQGVKNATSELAIALKISDRTANKDVTDQGLTSLSVGSVSLAFKDYFKTEMLNDAALMFLLQNWYTPEQFENALQATFEVLPTR